MYQCVTFVLTTKLLECVYCRYVAHIIESDIEIAVLRRTRLAPFVHDSCLNVK